jgi:hypothetical protein
MARDRNVARPPTRCSWEPACGSIVHDFAGRGDRNQQISCNCDTHDRHGYKSRPVVL